MYGTAPAGVQAFGPTPYINPQNSQQYLREYEAALQKAMGPQFKQQNLQLAQQNAARGITNSGAASYLQGNLLGQQAGALATADEPLIGQAMGNTQSDIMANAAAYNQDRYANFNDYNSYLNELFGAGQQTQSQLEEALLGSYGPNAGVGSMFGTAESGMNQAYTNVFDEMLASQGQALGAGAGAAGEVLAAGEGGG